LQPGYDTHYFQLFPRSQLLLEFFSAVEAFLDDLATAKIDDCVTALAFSGFGLMRAEEHLGR
jgi:hypothetical protein